VEVLILPDGDRAAVLSGDKVRAFYAGGLMAEPRFEMSQEIYVAQDHCDVCKKLESDLQHPIRVRAIKPYGDGFEYRIEDARGVHYETKEVCLCSCPSGHHGNPCNFCGQAVGNSQESVA